MCSTPQQDSLAALSLWGLGASFAQQNCVLTSRSKALRLKLGLLDCQTRFLSAVACLDDMDVRPLEPGPVEYAIGLSQGVHALVNCHPYKMQAACALVRPAQHTEKLSWGATVGIACLHHFIVN